LKILWVCWKNNWKTLGLLKTNETNVVHVGKIVEKTFGLLKKLLWQRRVCWQKYRTDYGSVEEVLLAKIWSLEKNSKQLVVCWKTDWKTSGHFKTD
jgi:hypothetical protein